MFRSIPFSKRSLRHTFIGLLTLAAMSANAMADHLKIVATTTHTAETSNNTSAPNAINASTKGYAASGNMSKLPIKSLLYSGATPKIYAALMGWFGKSGHISVGYNSQDATQVKKQVEDMQSRGIDGAVLAWYGKDSFENTTALQLKAAAEAHTDFSFILMIDTGTIKWDSMGLSATDALITHLNYMAETYYSSPAYAKIGGRPVVLEFDLEAWPIDWSRVVTSIQGNPVFIFRNPGAFTNTNAYGGYGWGPADGLSYTDYFNKTAAQYPAKTVMADAWKGFNDVLASWSASRVVDQQCGQTWLNSMAELSKYYSTSKQLPMLQIPTWNDYEEGTTIESGIDNCITVNATSSGNSLQWSLSGAGLENTIDHYTAFISTDGENLMSLGDVPTGTYSLDLSQFSLAPGNYTFYVKAIAKASLKNEMSNAVPFTKANIPPHAALSVTPASALSGTVVTATTTASSDPDGSIANSSIDFGDGTVMSGPTATHAYTFAGRYTVTATVTDNLGASATATAAVTAQNRAPKAALTVTPASAPSGAVLTASTAASTDPDGSIASSQINFGDGTISSATTATHSYTVPGTYTLTATVTDNMGATTIATKTVKVLNRGPVPALSVTPNNGYAPTTVSASTAGSSDAVGTLASSQIDFGDGTVVAATTASHQYAGAGTYTVTATVTDDLGAASVASQVVTISPAVVLIKLPPTEPTSTSPLHVVASAVSGNLITGMSVYLDSKLMYGNNTNSVDINLSVKTGTHVLEVLALDSAGQITTSSVTLDVAAGAITPRTSRTGTLRNVAARLSTPSGTSDPSTGTQSTPLPRARRLGR